MCAIAGIVSLDGSPVPELKARLAVMAARLAHRGPDGEGVWLDPTGTAGLAHRRLAIIDLSDSGAQPMAGSDGCQIVHNGEIYNYPELRAELEAARAFRSRSDTETILAAHEAWADDAPLHLRGMWAYALWNPASRRLFASRDRFGIKPFYYAEIGSHLYFASEIKAILPFLPQIEVNPAALAEYLTFQFTLGGDTLVKGIRQLPAAHNLIVENGRVREVRYWDVQYTIDRGRSAGWFHDRLTGLTEDSVRLHLRADTEVGSYLSGGIDSSLIALLAARQQAGRTAAFHGTFRGLAGFDESRYARIVAETGGLDLHEAALTSGDFRTHIFDVIRHLDEPIAGPGAFPQFMTAKLAASKVKVVLGGQGGDEIFGGYARYIIAYFEQCIKAAIDGTYKNGNFVVTIESIVPQLPMLHEYKPLLKTFWAEGLFDELDARYFRLINRSVDMKEEIEWGDFPSADVFEAFRCAFHGRNVGKEAYFDKMTHFDFKHLLPALLHVEDRMSMAHGLESRVPFLDHPLVEFAATAPADVKFSGGRSKQMLKEAFRTVLPAEISGRRDKMGFPVPLAGWFRSDLRELVGDLFGSAGAGDLPYLKPKAVRRAFDNGQPFSRKSWGLLSLEIWRRQMAEIRQQRFR
ncbi:asparagine synthase (glutamine-hydrolyzing) [Hyphomonas sp.]|jgi:asparagine synthase (glutamine-hydrolysing)|uniref:asparagine synthase (glutamine-hydrolyzing) n=1 Tax=Hyphomonas sp. TaxID=87 RepID=UPI00391D0221